jgi:acyl-CoA reductase-like NAD-dependent aldehyde dehydrogenase
MNEIGANTPEEVREAVAHARKTAPEWAQLEPAARAAMLALVRHRINERMDELVQVIAAENGKPPTEALAHDVVPSLLTQAYLEWIAPRALRPERVGTFVAPLLGMTSRIEWRPFGVVGCISPWNYPMFLAFMAITPALLAGNTVVLKPSEMTPAVGEAIRDLLSPLPPGVATVVQGGGEVGAALVDAPCDKICFIGSTATGRRIAEAAARHLTPVVMELGGQDTAIVCADADLDRASSGVLWGAFLNAGQTCCAIERAYVVAAVADRFEELLLEKVRRLRQGDDVGPLTIPRQLETVRRHVADAVDRGATLLAGGADGASPDGKEGGLWHAPTVLGGRTEEMAIFGEETFGPVLPIVRVRDEEDAVRRANEEGFNLTASVWTRDSRRGARLASRVKAGTVVINDHAVTASAPWGLWGGIGDSGYGRLHGRLGVREFTVPVHVATSLLPPLKGLWWFPYDRPTFKAMRSIAEVLSSPSLGRKLAAAGEGAISAIRAIRRKL